MGAMFANLGFPKTLGIANLGFPKTLSIAFTETTPCSNEDNVFFHKHSEENYLYSKLPVIAHPIIRRTVQLHGVYCIWVFSKL